MKILTLIMALSLLTACNTIAGVGEDVSGGARKVQDWIGN
jgi:predicted small secreted protein